LLLQIAALTKRYGHLTALSEVSFSIRPGEVLGLIGPNGSGKTTLFECLGGVAPCDSGTVSRDGRPLTSTEQRASVFYLPDAIAPWPSQTVRWALDFTIGFLGSGGPTRVGDVSDTCETGVRPVSDTCRTPSKDDVVRQLDLGPLLDSRIGTLSKGQRKRALLAIGLLTPQPILLADEPFDGLDLRQSRDVARTLREHSAAGRTLVLSIHQISDAARVCDRFVLLSGGRICGEGTLDELTGLARGRRGADAGPGLSDKDLEEVFLALT
jgi:ABC-2 type transport system ATP-binding protein